MSDASPSSTAGTQRDAPAERRRNPRLRALVDEMLASIRENVNQDLWTPEERARAQADLERIMHRVRETTFSPSSDPGSAA
jgi:hypothetical protein